MHGIHIRDVPRDLEAPLQPRLRTRGQAPVQRPLHHRPIAVEPLRRVHLVGRIAEVADAEVPGVPIAGSVPVRGLYPLPELRLVVEPLGVEPRHGPTAAEPLAGEQARRLLAQQPHRLEGLLRSSGSEAQPQVMALRLPEPRTVAGYRSRRSEEPDVQHAVGERQGLWVLLPEAPHRYLHTVCGNPACRSTPIHRRGPGGSESTVLRRVLRCGETPALGGEGWSPNHPGPTGAARARRFSHQPQRGDLERSIVHCALVGLGLRVTVDAELRLERGQPGIRVHTEAEPAELLLACPDRAVQLDACTHRSALDDLHSLPRGGDGRLHAIAGGNHRRP